MYESASKGIAKLWQLMLRKITYVYLILKKKKQTFTTL